MNNNGTTARRLLIVEDEPKIAALLRDYLAAEGYATEHYAEGRAWSKRCGVHRPICFYWT